MPPHERRHVFFFQQMAALWRLEGEDRRQSEREGVTVCGFPLFSSRLYDSCFLFTPYCCLGTETWQNFVFICPKTVVWYCNCQLFRAMLAHSSTVVKCAAIKKKKSSLWFSLQLYEMASLIPNVLEGCDVFFIPPC